MKFRPCFSRRDKLVPQKVYHSVVFRMHRDKRVNLTCPSQDLERVLVGNFKGISKVYLKTRYPLQGKIVHHGKNFPVNVLNNAVKAVVNYRVLRQAAVLLNLVIKRALRGTKARMIDNRSRAAAGRDNRACIKIVAHSCLPGVKTKVGVRINPARNYNFSPGVKNFAIIGMGKTAAYFGYLSALAENVADILCVPGNHKAVFDKQAFH
jgi:hypothetical protein